MKATLLSIDPGFRYLGYSVFSEGTLLEAGLLKSAETPSSWAVWGKQPPSFLHLVEVIRKFDWVEQCSAVIEYPKVHKDTPNPEAIVKLAAACGAYTGLLQAAGFGLIWVEPYTWKGNVPKEVSTRRILAKIPKEDYSKISNVRDHNILDAIGIGLWATKKINRDQDLSIAFGETGLT